MGSGMEVRVLGAAEVRYAGVPMTKWRAGKTKTLLHYLALQHGRVVARSKLVDVLWPDGEQADGNASLKVAIHALRKALQDCSVGLERPIAEVRYVDFGYELVAEDLWVDSVEFARLARQGATLDAAGEVDAARAAYEDAVAIYRGPFLPEDESDWAREERMWIESMGLKVLCRLATLAVEQGEDMLAIEYCKRVLHLDPYNERAYRRMMEIHGRSRELGMALRWFSECDDRLQRGLGVPPSENTHECLVKVLAMCGVPVDRRGARKAATTASSLGAPRGVGVRTGN